MYLEIMKSLYGREIVFGRPDYVPWAYNSNKGEFYILNHFTFAIPDLNIIIIKIGGFKYY